MVSLTKERTVVIKVDEGCKIEISRNAIATVLKDATEVDANKAEKKDVNDNKTNTGILGLFKKKDEEKK